MKFAIIALLLTTPAFAPCAIILRLLASSTAVAAPESGTPTPDVFYIYEGSETIVTMTGDGKLVFGDGVSPEYAADKAFMYFKPSDGGSLCSDWLEHKGGEDAKYYSIVFYVGAATSPGSFSVGIRADGTVEYTGYDPTSTAARFFERLGTLEKCG